MNLRQKTARGVAWSTIENLGGQALYFIVFLLLARLLGSEAFGLVSLAGVFISFMAVFADQGLSGAIIQRQELEPEHLDTAFWSNLGISTLLTLITLAAAAPVAIFFKQPQLTPIISWLSLTFLISGFSSVQQSLLRRQLAFRTLAMRSLLSMSVAGTVGVVMAYYGCGVWSLVGQQLVNRFVAAITLWWVSDWRPGLKFSLKHFQDLFSFGINLLGGSILSFFSIRSDDFLIGYFLGPIALGYYSVAYRLLVAMTQILSATIQRVALPTFSRLQSEPAKLERAFFSATQLVSFITFPAFLGVAVLAPEIIRTLFGEQWMPSAPVMQFLALSGITQSLFTISGLVMVSVGKPSWNLKIMFANTIVNVIGFAIAVQWGIVAVAASFAIRAYLMLPIQLWAIYKLLRINLATYFSQFVAPLSGAMVMAVTVLGTKHFLSSFTSPILLGACIAIGAVTYLTVILLISPQLLRQVIDLCRSTLPAFKQKT